jgi:hypothetical protein
VVSEYICRLYRYFVYYDIDATIESNIIAFGANYWLKLEVAPVLNQLLKPTFL